MYCIEENTEIQAPEPKFYSLWSIITFIFTPPLWFLSVPALIFSAEAKSLYNSGNFALYEKYSLRTKKFIVSSWAIFLILAASIITMCVILHLSLV